MHHCTILTGPPTIIMHPNDEVIAVNTSVTLNCKGTGKRPITYQWQSKPINRNRWMNVRKSNNQNLVVMNLQQSQQYRCVVSNEAGDTRSNVATVTVLSELCANFTIIIIILTTGISNQPMSHTVIALNDATLNCTTPVDGARYLWRRVNGMIPSRSQGRRTFTLTIPGAIPPDEGMYYCIISKDAVTVESDRATIEVNGKFIFAVICCTKYKNMRYIWVFTYISTCVHIIIK